MGTGLRIQCEVIISFPAGGIQGSLDRSHTRIADGRGRQTDVQPGVIRAFFRQEGFWQIHPALVLRMHIQNRGVNAERHPGREAVIDHRSDKRPFLIVCRFLFDHGSYDHGIPECRAAILDLFPHIRSDAGMQRSQEFVDNGARLLTLIKIICVREDEALQP